MSLDEMFTATDSVKFGNAESDETTTIQLSKLTVIINPGEFERAWIELARFLKEQVDWPAIEVRIRAI